MNGVKGVSELKKYLFITFLISWLLWSPPLLDSQHISIPGFLMPISMIASFVPSVTGLLLIYHEDGKAGLLEVWNKVTKLDFNKYWLVPTLLLLPVTAAFSYFIGTGIFGGEGLNISAYVIITVVVMFFIGGPLGEEFGWRGFLLNHLLERYSVLRSGIILGLIWGVWHLPLHFITGSTQEYVPVWADIFMMTVVSVLFTWIFVNTGRNMLVALIFHWSINLSVILFPYWQVGGENIEVLPNLWIPTPGMLVGFLVLILVTVIIVCLYRRNLGKINPDRVLSLLVIKI